MSTQIKRAVFKVTRPVKDSRRALKAQLDRVFSLFIRLRDGSCVLCGSTQNLECGHFIGRGNPALRFHPLNAHCLCHICNLKDNEDKTAYRQFYLRIYGQSALDSLDEINLQYNKATDEELRGQIKIFTDLVAILKDERSYL